MDPDLPKGAAAIAGNGSEQQPARADRAPSRQARAQGRDRPRGARPLRRVVAARAPLAPPPALLPPRRARWLVAVGAVPALLRPAWLGGPCPQPAGPLLVPDRGHRGAQLRHLPRGCHRRLRGARAPGRGGRPRHGRPAGHEGRRGPRDRRPRAHQPGHPGAGPARAAAPRGAPGARDVPGGAHRLGRHATSRCSARTRT